MVLCVLKHSTAELLCDRVKVVLLALDRLLISHLGQCLLFMLLYAQNQLIDLLWMDLFLESFKLLLLSQVFLCLSVFLLLLVSLHEDGCECLLFDQLGVEWHPTCSLVGFPQTLLCDDVFIWT